MAAPTIATPEQAVGALLEAFDALDVDTIRAMMDDDPQGVDELSGGWRRGRAGLDAYFDEITSAGISNVRSTVSDLDVRDWGDTAVATCMIDQEYDLAGEHESITAPMTVLLRRDDAGAWRIALVHAVPLPK